MALSSLSKVMFASISTPSTGNVIIFQYNPQELTRNLIPQTTADSDDRSEPMRLKGPPIETISLKAEIDAANQLNHSNGLALQFGIYPQLSALEILVYPKSSDVIANTASLAAGTLEILPGTAPMTLFTWGISRIVPVRITEFSIIEELYDTKLNPIRAEVSLSLRVLSYEDVSSKDAAYQIFLTHQVMKETMAALNAANTVAVLTTS